MNHLPSDAELRAMTPVVRKLVSARLRQWTPHADITRDDLVQDTLLAVCRSWERRPAEPSEVAAWVNVITQHRLSDAMRKLAKRPPHYDIDVVDHHPLTPAEMVERDALEGLTHPFGVLGCLNPRARWVMQMVSYDVGNNTIAHRTGTSVGAIRVVIHRARTRLTAARGARSDYLSRVLPVARIRLPDDVTGDITGLAEACRSGQAPILTVTRTHRGWTATDRFSELALVAAVLEEVERVPVLVKPCDQPTGDRTSRAAAAA
ncbi:sigma factor [Actinosynnema sp. NPDC051121]